MEKIQIKPIPPRETRLNFLKGFIGTNRTGKTSLALEIAKSWRSSRPDDTIISFDPQYRFREISDYIISIDDEHWAKKCMDIPNSLVILDDYKMLCPKNVSSKELNSLLYKRGDNNIDIIYICHSPALILNIFTYLTTHYYIFHTMSTDGSFAKKIPNYHLCIAAANEVNKYVKMYGRGKHPDDPTFNGIKFPYIIIDTEKQKLTAINMINKKKELK